jgi:signal transduction histidine kinase
MPQEVLPKRIFSGDHDCDLISLRASIADTYRSSSGIELRLRLDGFSIQAILPLPVATMPEIGSTVLVTGICQVESSTDKGFRSQPERATLLLRDASDLRVLQAPGFWTARRLAMATALLGAVILLGLIWITLLRRQVAKQSTALRERIAHEAALEERQRIAREFHDTLEQELAGLSLRLDAATTRPLEDKARSLLDASRHLVSRIQSEARNLVADLRTNPDESADLSAALRELAARSPVHDHPALQVHVEEPIPPLPAHVVHHLRMMAQEAVTNALKHAQASEITIGLRVEDARLRLSIQDNGRGLNAAATQGTPGHFGCMGMRERCLRIHAEVAWQSQPGQGTTVTVTLPLNLKPELRVHG